MKKIILSFSTILILAGCIPDDPYTPNIQLTEKEFYTCQYDAALKSVEKSIKSANGEEIYLALIFKAAILQDMGKMQESETIYPAILKQAEVQDGKLLTQDSMKRDINLYISHAHKDREKNKVSKTCQAVNY
ncbi:MAG: hypothetical protein KAG43_04195 [Candidatus Marithrix sp.]|nr:hypothetical protein [Candidatus Marithrix sp.]